MGYIQRAAEKLERLKSGQNINILAIETSCDETSCAVVRNGREALSNVISTQIEVHKKYGGVVPEIASRKHIELIDYVVDESIKEAKVQLKSIDAIAVTMGPGLVGALLVGVSHAKAMAFALE
ncbi:MAG: tRNA (adenosine(37)-N6)-threonylcarbamoyltransferase complex transferase subunit TsaD, partial [Bacillota bacterium]